MEPVTHFLTGACMGRAGFNGKTALATLTMTLAAEAADLDVLWDIEGPVAGFQHHRGITHSFLAVPVIAAATVGFVWLLCRWRAPDGRPRILRSKLPVRWNLLFGLALIAGLSHILLDYTTQYGIRMFAPFNWRWYSWDIVFIVDPIILLVLIAGLLLPALFALVNEEVGARSRGPRGRGWAIFALLCVVLIWGFRDYQHRRALNAMSAVTYQGSIPVKYAAYPYWINPFEWYGVVETPAFFQTLPVYSLTPEVDPQGTAATYFKPEDSPVLQAAKQSHLGRVYLDWSVFPYIESQPLQGETKGYKIDFLDLRYAYPEIRARKTLGAWVIVGPDLRVLEEGMNSHRPSPQELH